MRTTNRWVIWGMLLLAAMTRFASAQADETATRVGKIRAALVFYITKFIQPPASASERIVFCTTGADALVPFLPSTFEGKRISGRELSIRELPSPATQDSLKGCEVVLVGAETDLKKASETLANINNHKDRALLSICAVKGVTWGECLIQIFEMNNKARVAIDLERLEKAGFKASSELLEVSVVRGKE